MQNVYDRIDPMFLATRETFPGEKTFAELSRDFFERNDTTTYRRAARIGELHADGGLLVHMANPEQIDDLFAHIDREKNVRYLSTSYLHREIRATVYAIGRGTGILLDGSRTAIEHVSVNDSATVTDAAGNLVASDHARVTTIAELHAALFRQPRDEWNEVNVSFEGPAAIVGFFALDGVLSKIYGTAVFLKAGRRLPLFTYNRALNRLAEFRPTAETLTALIDQVPAPVLRDRCRSLLEALA